MNDQREQPTRLRSLNPTSPLPPYPTHPPSHSTLRERHRKKGSDTSHDVVGYLVLKEKFDQIYKRIERISLKDEQPHKPLRKNTERGRVDTDRYGFQRICAQDAYLTKNFISLSKKRHQPTDLQVNTMVKVGTKSKESQQRSRKVRYRKKKLEPISKNLSNNIKDYLSIGKIAPSKQGGAEIKIMVPKPQKKARASLHNSRSEMLSPSVNSHQNIATEATPSTNLSPKRQPPVKFKQPFDMYFYRDLQWKVGYSNQLVRQPPSQYSFKVKYYVGSGNNCNLIRATIRRRPWLVPTQKMQEAHFVWTQLKIANIFHQQPSESQPQPTHQQFPALKERKIIGTGHLLLNQKEKEQWFDYWKSHQVIENNLKENMNSRNKNIKVSAIPVGRQCIHNHMPRSFVLGDKKALVKTMTEFCQQEGEEVFDRLPLTFHLTEGLEDDQYLKFLQSFYSIARQNKQSGQSSANPHNAWIVKPGEISNRGRGIEVCLELSEIKQILRRREKHGDGSVKTYVVQKYIERPLLYCGRKFDLRHYALVRCSNGHVKGYWYKQGYVRTASQQYSLKHNSPGLHLTNDAVQKQLPNYGKHQQGNKVTYHDLSVYLKKQHPSHDFWEDIYPQMKKLTTQAIRAGATTMDPHRRDNFELLGLDFMVDQQWKVWLIEVNTNPCLQTSCLLLAKLVPPLIQNTLQICLDSVFPAPTETPQCRIPLNLVAPDFNKYELIFDERTDSHLKPSSQPIPEPPSAQDVFDDDGDDMDAEADDDL